MTRTTLIGCVTDDTPATLEYGDYRGYVEIDAMTGEWIRNVANSELGNLERGRRIYSEEYDDLRPVVGHALMDPSTHE